MSSAMGDRAELLEGLVREMRWGSALSVLFSHVMATRAGLRSTDLEALDILDLTGPIPAGRLAELTGLTTGAVTALVDRLAAAGCVARTPDAADRRRVIVSPLPPPAWLVSATGPAYALMQRRFEELCQRYSDDDLSRILSFLRGSNAAARDTIAQVRLEANATSDTS